MNAKSAGLTVGDVTRTQLYTLPSTATIKDAAAELIRRDIECILVKSPDGEHQLLTELALLEALLPSPEELFSEERMPDESALEEIAREHSTRTLGSTELRRVHTVKSSHPALKALARMRADNQRRLLVTDDKGALVGIVTQRDLLRSVLLNLYVSYED